MSLNKARLKGKIKAAFLLAKAEEQSAETALDQLCEELASGIVDEVKELKISYTTGLTSATGGLVTGTLNHTIS